MDMEHETFKILSELIEEELHLYKEDELVILCECSMIVFTRSLLKISIKNVESYKRPKQ